ncbi:MAG: MFS transporter [Thermodesulfobacteriota bacterium]
MTRKQILTFIAMGIGVSVITVDIAAINVALPAVEKSFKTTVGTIEWVINGYALSFGVLMVTCGRLADTFGRRKIFFIGLLIFALASLLGSLSNSASLLIVARVIQGVGAAMLWPSILGIIYSSVSEEQKGFAMGLILGAAGVGNAAGPLIGGFLTEFASWRWVLFVNVPLCIIAGIITYLEVEKQDVEPGEKKVDYLGIFTISFSLVSLLYALNMFPNWGLLSYKTILLLVMFLVAMALFISIERRTKEALIPSDVMSNMPFMISATTMFTVIPAFFALLLYLPQYVEKFLDYSPLGAGAALVPMLLSFALVAPISGKIFNRIGAKISIFIGMVLTCIGTVAIIKFGFGSNYYGLLPGLVIVGIGLGFSVPSITTAAVGAVKESRASLAGGIVYMFQLVGGALGLAVVTSIFTDFAKNDLLIRLSGAGISVSQTERSEIINFILGSGSKQVLSDSLGQEKFVEVFTYIHHAYITGVNTGLAFAALFVAVGALLALFFVKGKVSQNNID